MTDIDKQRQAIREGAEKLFCKACHAEETDPFYDTWEECYQDGVCAYCTDTIASILAFESDHGAVLKVRGEVPTTPPTYGDTSHTEGWEEGQYHMKQIGYILTAPLVAPEGQQPVVDP